MTEQHAIQSLFYSSLTFDEVTRVMDIETGTGLAFAELVFSAFADSGPKFELSKLDGFDSDNWALAMRVLAYRRTALPDGKLVSALFHYARERIERDNA